MFSKFQRKTPEVGFGYTKNCLSFETSLAKGEPFCPELFALKSNPKIEFLETGIYGEWSFTYKNFIFLQKWNSEKNADANIIQVNTATLEVTTIKENILSVFWEAKVVQENKIEFNFTNINKRFTYNLETK